MHSVPGPVYKPGKYPGYWYIKEFRRSLRNRLSAWLARHTTGVPPLSRLDPAAIRRVIVCRRNKRLGNMLFLTPLLHSLAATLPRAQIDLLIGDASYAPLFTRLPGVRQVWGMPARGISWPLRMLWLLLRLRMQSYDLVIEPSQNSFTNRLSAQLCGAQWRLGFHTPDQWLKLTHAVIADGGLCHEALLPLQLINDGFDPEAVHLYQCLDVALSVDERLAGRAQLDTALGDSGSGPVLGFFIEATGKKQLSTAWWQAWLAEIRRAQALCRLVQILPPERNVALAPDIARLSEADYRRLAAILGSMDLFVCCDAGPMHLAAAAGTPVVGLFHTTNAERYRPLGDESIVLEVKDISPAQSAQAVLLRLRGISAAFQKTPTSFAPHTPMEGRRVDRQAHIPANHH